MDANMDEYTLRRVNEAIKALVKLGYKTKEAQLALMYFMQIILEEVEVQDESSMT